MQGQNKAFLDVGGETILDRLLVSLQVHFDEILLVTREPAMYAGHPVRVVQDIYTSRASLTGIHAGLVNASAEYLFVVPSDTPFLQPDLIRLLLDKLQSDKDVVVPYFDGHYQPLCAIYSKRCLPVIESQLDHADYKIINILGQMNVKIISAEDLKQADPQRLSFYNVNTPAAYKACHNLIQR